MSSSTFAGNHVSVGYGGGIFAEGSVTITSSSISGNTASSGGGISADTVDVTSSSIYANTVTGMYSGDGGGISGHNIAIYSSTISHNSAVFGGGLKGQARSVDGHVIGSTVIVASSTIFGNTADVAGGIEHTGGGLPEHGLLTITNSIVAGNSAPIGPEMTDVDGRASVRRSLIGNNTGTRLTEAPLGSPDSDGNLIGGPINGVINPLLGPLADNGGPTWTHALLPGSPAIEAGDPAIQHSFIEFDQRGAPYYRVADGDLPDDIIMDIGAYETQRPPSADFDENNVVNGRDALLWQRGYGMTVDATRSDGNSDDDQDVDASDRAAWEVSFGQGFELPQETLGDANLGRRPSRAELIDAALAYVMAEAGVAEDESVLAEERLIEPVLPLGVERIDPARASLVQSFRVARSDLQSIGADDFEIEQQVSVFWERGETL